MKDGDTPPAPAALTAEDITHFFDTKFRDFKCPACGKEEFTVLFSEDHEFGSVPAGKGDVSIPDEFVGAVIATCDNCFYILPFSRPLIAKWIAQQRNGASNVQA